MVLARVDTHTFPNTHPYTHVQLTSQQPNNLQTHLQDSTTKYTPPHITILI